jgi:lysophospholipase L1-like esterase
MGRRGIGIGLGRAPRRRGGQDVHLASLAGSYNLLFVGDSTMVGVGAGSGGSADVNGSRPYSVPLQAAARLAARGYKVATETLVTDNNNGTAAATWQGYRPEVTVVGSINGASDSPQIGGVHLNIGAGSNSVAYATAAEVDRLDLLLHRRSDFGVLGVSIDGGAVQEFSLANAVEDLAWQSITGLTLAPHTFTFTRVSGACRFPVMFDAYNSAENAFHICNAGARNWTTTDWVVADHPNSPLSAIAYAAPDVVVIDLGINDWRQSGTSIATFKANMQTIIDACLAAEAQVVLCIPHAIQTYVTASDAWSLAATIAAYQDLAAANSCALVNAPHEFYAAGLAAADPATYAAMDAAGLMNDSLHTRPLPYQIKGHVLADVILTKLELD